MAGLDAAALAARTLLDGGQAAEDIGGALVDWLSRAGRSLDLALYDVRLPGAVGEEIAAAIRAAAARGVTVRIAYNHDEDGRDRKPLPPPPRTEPELLETLGVPLRAIPGVPDLMHHKYVVRDGASVWSGSTNWTDDSWTREENVIVIVESTGVAIRYQEDFAQLWKKRKVESSGKVPTDPIPVGDADVRTWFSPKRGEKLAHEIARAIGDARRRVRIASPVITSGPILGTLAEVAADKKVDLAGVVDATQIHEVFEQWRMNGNNTWKTPSLMFVLRNAAFTGKRSTPYAPGAVHDYMHAKVCVCDDTVFIGSFNLSHSGEQNAENVVEIADAQLAEQMASFVDAIRAKYPALALD